MTPVEVGILIAAIFVLAVLYSSVGHAGASGYLAAMALVAGAVMTQHEMKAVALTLNIFVGSIGTYRFARAGHFHWHTFWPFGLCAIPMAFVGGLWQLPDIVFKPLIGVVLAYAAGMLIWRAVRAHRASSVVAANEARANPTGDATERMPPVVVALVVGAGLGLLAGLTGTGGGIFLSPLLILFGWAGPKRTAAVSVVFVLLNSIAGLAGRVSDVQHLPDEIPFYIVAAVAGGLIGSGLGASRKTSGDLIRALLGVVLIIASIKMFLTTFG